MDNSMLQQNLNMGMFNIIKTGNPLIDAIILSLVGTLVVNNVTKVINSMSSLNLMNIYFAFYMMIRNLYNKILGKEKTIIKYVQISSITDEKKHNELYDAVYWYITNAEEIDYIRETPIKFSYDNNQIKNVNEDDNVKLNKITSKYNEKSLIFKKHEITYMLGTELITVYADEERKKENRSITLSTKISETATEDIIDQFCVECVKKYAHFLQNKNWEPKLYYNSGGKWVSKPMKSKRRIETIILPREMKKKIIKDLDFFMTKKEWFNNIGIPYSRGYLYYGPPGCGKTSLIKAMSNYCKRNIHYLIPNDIQNDSELYALLADIDYASTILVAEDIDCASKVIKKRENGDKDNSTDASNEDIKEIKDALTKIINDKQDIRYNDHNNTSRKSKESGITLSGLLNAIDGVNEAEGRILIMTTNKPETLDDALIRPGRIDKKFLFDLCTREQIGDMYKMFFDVECDQKELETIEENKYSPSYIATLFMQYVDNPNEALKNIGSDDTDMDLKLFDIVKINKISNSVTPKINTKMTLGNNMNQISQLTLYNPQDPINFTLQDSNDYPFFKD